MNLFNLSLMAGEPVSEVKATKELPIEENPKTGEETPETITEGGLKIDKSLAPKLVLAGSVGHLYTEILNRELSLESMGAVMAALGDIQKSDRTSKSLDPGMIEVTGDETTIVHEDPDVGYIFIAEGKDLDRDDFRKISGDFMAMRARYPNKPLGLAMLGESGVSETMESLRVCLGPAGVQLAFTQGGFKRMVLSMVRGV